MRLTLLCVLYATEVYSFKRTPQTPKGRGIKLASFFNDAGAFVEAFQGLQTIHDHSFLADHIQTADTHIFHSFLVADGAGDGVGPVVEKAATVSPYSKVDRTGFIGSIASVIETAIEFGHNALQGGGMGNTYGFSILIFTMLIKAATLPLTSAQLESTSKLQAIAPLQQKIIAKYSRDDNTKNQVLAMLFQAANVNPLAGCFPALVQIPVFLSLYRALTNMIAENKLDEPFFWIPDLEGPNYVSTTQTEESANWLMSIFTGAPSLGWHDTVAFLSVPAILFITQTISQKVLTPQRDPSKPMTEQEEISQGVINNLPFIVAFFSINVPAGLGIYWIFNNIITTVITIVLKSKFAGVKLPPAVDELMSQVESGTVALGMMGGMGGGMGSGMGGSGIQTPSPSASSSVIDVDLVETSEPREETKEEKLIAEMKRMNEKAKELLKKERGEQ